MGGMPGTGGTGGSGGAPGVGGGVVTGGAPGVGGSGGDPGPTFQVFCDVACAVGEVCCVGQAGATNTYIGCAAPGTCPGNTYFVMSCDGQEDCAGGDICCAHRRGDKWDAIQCAANCTQNVNGERLACGGPGAPNQAVCPGTSTCLIGNDLPNFYNCSGS
jgi:hypothetical protein